MRLILQQYKLLNLSDKPKKYIINESAFNLTSIANRNGSLYVDYFFSFGIH